MEPRVVSICVLVIALLLLIASAVLCYFEHKYMRNAKAKQKEAEEKLQSIEDQIRKEAQELHQKHENKITSLPPDQFFLYIANIYSKILELESAAHETTKNPNAGVDLYARTLAALEAYLGDETVEAIEYYYGKNYLGKWSSQCYRLLENRGMLPGIIEGHSSFESIEASIKR